MSRTSNTQLRNPFPGLRPFREDEEHLFFGRESQVHAMVDRLAATRFLAVVGTSGSGKSSLVNCGLRPALRRGLMTTAGSPWRMAQFRPGGAPLSSFARALAEDGVLFTGFRSSVLKLEDILEASLRISKLGLCKVYGDAHLPQGTNLLVVVDQFEELFRYRDIESSLAPDAQQRVQDATAFVNLLLHPRTQTELPIYVVLTMRSDFLGQCAEFGGLPEAINQSEYLIPRLTRDERRAAIAGPIGVGGAKITPVLLTRLVNDVGDNPDQLSILQHALSRTWAYWERNGEHSCPLDLEHYEGIGAMAHALDWHAEQAFNEELPSDRHRKICEKVFKALTDKHTDARGIRRPIKFAVLCKLTNATPLEITEILDVFRDPTRSFIVPPLPEPIRDDTVIDISHESFMRLWQRLITWTEEEAQSAQLYERLSETAALHAAGKAALWDDPDLQYALDWKERERPTEVWAELYGGGFQRAIDFLAKSKTQRDKEQQEKEEHRQRELQQAQALAAERQQRIEEQSRAAALLRRWLFALAVVAVGLFVVGAVAWRALAEARSEERKAGQALALAQAEQTKEEKALRAEKTALKATDDALQRAQEADAQMRLEALRLRNANLFSASTTADLAGSFLEKAHPQEAAPWRNVMGDSLLSLGSYKDAEDSFSKVLDANPNDADARTMRGYLSMLVKRPQDAQRDFQYLHDNIDPAFPINNLNLSLANAALGKYGAARASVREAIGSMRHHEQESGGEDLIPPDITIATGLTTLDAQGAAFETALYYMQANIEAYDARAQDFQKALERADDKAQSLLPPARRDAYFVAMTWAWLHLRIRCPEPGAQCKDYGGFASQAALWERAGYKDWAACSYDTFEDKNRSFHDSRYVQLAMLVKQSRGELGSAKSCQELRHSEPDVPTLEVEAREARARKNYPEAKELVKQALAKSGADESDRLLFLKLDVLFDWGVEASGDSDKQSSNADAARQRLDQLQRDEKKEEESLRTLASQAQGDTNSGPAALDEIKKRYDKKTAAARDQYARAEDAMRRDKEESTLALQELERDCTQILKHSSSPIAYYYRARAKDWLNPSDKTVLDDLHQSLRLDPAYMDALDWIDRLVPAGRENERQYLLENRPFLDRYFKFAPYRATTFMHQAKLAQLDKHYSDALQYIDTAIAMDPANGSFYEIRADIQKALGFNEAQRTRNLAEGYQQAAFMSAVRGTGMSAGFDQEEWGARIDLVKEHPADELRCDAALKTCLVIRTVPEHGEWIYSRILSVKDRARDEKFIVAEINRGSNDGIVVGLGGNVWSRYSEKDKRQVAKLGTSEVVSLSSHSALVRIQVEQPKGDGLVRDGDMVQLEARTPALEGRSPLWKLATYDVTFLDSVDNVLFDYDTLYSDETPDLDAKLYERMLEQIHQAARSDAKNVQQVKDGKFARQSIAQAMETATTADVQGFIEYLTKYPGAIFGLRFETSRIYAAWLTIGAPLE